MNNRIRAGGKSKPTSRCELVAGCHYVYGFKTNADEFSEDAPALLNKSRWLLEDQRVFALAANAIREEEKARVARELHDELAQSLTVLKMDAIWVRDNVAQFSQAVTVKLSEMVTLLDQTVAATRRIAADLRPLLLDDLGLVPAIEWLVNSFTRRHEIACTLSVDPDLELVLQEPHATAVFRIIQESLVNVAKHAGASQVAVSLGKVTGGIVLVIQDDGCGFFAAAPLKPQSLGLMGLRERAELLGGNVNLKSCLGEGTCIEIWIPLANLKARQ